MKYNFAQNFRMELTKKAVELTETLTNSLEKEMLSEHKLLIDLTTLPYTKKVNKSDNLAILIGTAQGMDNVHRSYMLSKEIQKRNKKTKITFVTSGAIGVSMNVVNKPKVPGVNSSILTEMLKEYGVSASQIITEKFSRNADEQAQEFSLIASRFKFKNVILVVDTWHGPRFYMSMIKHNSNINFFTEYVDSDIDHIGAATHDFGQKYFQSPLFIGEIARIHTYFEKGSGTVGIKELLTYLKEKQKKSVLPKSLTKNEMKTLKKLWNKNHTDIVENFEKLAAYR